MTNREDKQEPKKRRHDPDVMREMEKQIRRRSTLLDKLKDA